MSREIIFLFLGGSIGFASSILTLFTMYYLETLRLKRQWAREDALEQNRLRQEMNHLAQTEQSDQLQDAQPEIVTSPSKTIPDIEAIPTNLETMSETPISDDLDTLKSMLSEETKKPKQEQKEMLIKRLQTSIEWFEKAEATPEK